MPNYEKKWQKRYQKSPSFLSLHLGVKAGFTVGNRMPSYFARRLG